MNNVDSIIADPSHPNVVNININSKHLGPVALALLGRTEKCSPMRLAPIPWGKKDPKLGALVCQNIVDTMPPIVVPWSIRTARMVQIMRANGGVDLKVRDLRTLMPERFPRPLPRNL